MGARTLKAELGGVIIVTPGPSSERELRILVWGLLKTPKLKGHSIEGNSLCSIVSLGAGTSGT